MRVTAAIAAAAVALIAPRGAGAQLMAPQTIGSDLAGTPTNTVACTNVPCTVVGLDGATSWRAPADGLITRVRFYTGDAVPAVGMHILGPGAGPGEATFGEVFPLGGPFIGGNPMDVLHTVNGLEIPVEEDDTLALTAARGPGGGTISYYDPSPGFGVALFDPTRPEGTSAGADDSESDIELGAQFLWEEDLHDLQVEQRHFLGSVWTVGDLVLSIGTLKNVGPHTARGVTLENSAHWGFLDAVRQKYRVLKSPSGTPVKCDLNTLEIFSCDVGDLGKNESATYLFAYRAKRASPLVPREVTASARTTEGKDNNQSDNLRTRSLRIRKADDAPKTPGAGCARRLRLGTAADDRLRGTRRGEAIFGFDGNDRIRGRGGGDCIVGDQGKDVLKPGRGRDLVVAGAGRDVVRAVDSNRDRIRCGAGRDRAIVDRGLDRVSGCERVIRV